MIAHKLMSMDGWKVHEYYPDNSDSMTDYYGPASWNGIAEKNGYVLCINVYGAESPREIKEYVNDGMQNNVDVTKKIRHLEEMTVARGASEAEERSAKGAIVRLQKKLELQDKGYIVTWVIPGHQAHPPRMNWHLEKDGVIAAKGNGILKYRSITKYYRYESYKHNLDVYRRDPDEFRKKLTHKYLVNGYYDDEEEASRCANKTVLELEQDVNLVMQFEELINTINATCGTMVGNNNNSFVYEKVTITKYRKELQAAEIKDGDVREGQLFMLNSLSSSDRDEHLELERALLTVSDPMYFLVIANEETQEKIVRYLRWDEIAVYDYKQRKEQYRYCNLELFIDHCPYAKIILLANMQYALPDRDRRYGFNFNRDHLLNLGKVFVCFVTPEIDEK